MNKSILLRALFVFVLIYMAAAQAEPTKQAPISYGGETVVYNTSISNSDERKYNRGIAMSMSANYCNFDFSGGWQGCAGVANFQDENAFNLQAAHRVQDLLISGGIQCDTDADNCGVGSGVTWHF